VSPAAATVVVVAACFAAPIVIGMGLDLLLRTADRWVRR
jgi:hypothetical protein